MALVLARHPELAGHAAFLAACGCGPTTVNPEDGFHHITVMGVSLRISQDLEYIVEQDLFASRKTASMDDKKAVTAAAYRVRAAYSATRRESQVGDRRLHVYRQLREDPEAAIFFGKSRALGGKTPPPVMAISVIRYYINDMGSAMLGLDDHPEFLALVNGIELLPKCSLDEKLHGKFKRPKTEDEDETAADESGEGSVAEATTTTPDSMEEALKQRDAALAQVKALKKRLDKSANPSKLTAARAKNQELAELRDNLSKLSVKVDELAQRLPGPLKSEEGLVEE